MRPDNERDTQRRIDPALDAHLRDIIQRPMLSAAQHERIRARIGLHGTSTRTTSSASERRSSSRHADDGNATVGPRLNDETASQGGFSMIPHARERSRSQLYELAAVLAVIVVAVAAFAIWRSYLYSTPQQVGAPATQTATTTPAPTEAPAPSATATEVVILPTPDANGIYSNLTVDQARALAPFPLQIPDRLPEGIELRSIAASEGPVSDSDDPIITVTLIYEVSGKFAAEPIEFLQVNNGFEEVPGEGATIVDLAGHQVTKEKVEAEGRQPLVRYSWQIDGVYGSLRAVISDTLPETLADELVSAIFGLEGDAIPGENANDGVHVYEGLSPAEARQIVPLAMLFAEPVPAGLNAPEITAEIVDQTDGTESIRVVRAIYPVTADPTQPVEYTQSNQRPQNPPGGEMSTVELGGWTINKALVGDGAALAIYTWSDRGTFSTVSGTLSDDLTTELIESLVAATVATSPERHAVNEPVLSSGIEVTVTNVSYPATFDTAPPEGTSYIVVTGTFENQSIVDEEIWRYHIEHLLGPMLFDESSWSYPFQSASVSADVAELRLDDTATFELVYTVPTGTTDLILTFKPDPTTPDDECRHHDLGAVAVPRRPFQRVATLWNGLCLLIQYRHPGRRTDRG